jgi:hypothetical protein
MRVKTASTFIYIVRWGGGAVRVLFPGYFLLLSVAHLPSVSTLVAQQDPRRPILEEFNFGNRPVTYASLKTENMFVYRGYGEEERVPSTAENSRAVYTKHVLMFYAAYCYLCRSQWPRGLRQLACPDCGFDSHRGHGCLLWVLCVVRLR